MSAARQQQTCRIAFAPLNGLQRGSTILNDVGQAQLALAEALLAGMQLLPAVQHQRQLQPLQPSAAVAQAPFARVQLPDLPFQLLQGPTNAAEHPPQPGSSSSSSSAAKAEPERRFPFILIQSASQPQSSSSSSGSGSSSHEKQQQQQQQLDRNKLRTRGNNENPASMPGTVCLETDAGGRQRVYCIRRGVDSSSGKAWEGFDMVDDPQTHQGRLAALVRSYLLPQGFPDSVAPQYATYMGWRGVQYFFGGAMSVFTTKCLLTSLGVAGRHSGEAAAAINWVLKDGAGRLGRFLFARWGRELDCELKQFRLAGDLLMEAGAALELSTILAPQAFLPLACSANLAKNLAAVAASSTRAPIYRTFALQNNLADITAKGESVANLADILGTLAGILLSKWRLPMLPTFAVLSAGYLLASRKEVDSVELPYLNRARLAYTATKFLASGTVPGVPEANKHEPLLPWGRYHQGRVVLGSRVEAACATPADLAHAAGLYKSEKFILCYRADAKKVHVLLRQGASPTDCLKAAFSAHVFLHMLDEEHTTASAGKNSSSSSSSSNSAAAADTAAAAAAAGAQAAEGATAAGSRSRRGSSSSSSSKQSKQSKHEQRQAEGTAAAAAAAALQLTGPALVRDTWKRLSVALPWSSDGSIYSGYYRKLLERSKSAVDSLYSDFSRQADRQGWKLGATMLNPREARLLKLQLTV